MDEIRVYIGLTWETKTRGKLNTDSLCYVIKKYDTVKNDALINTSVVLMS